ncbi:hypothetical protein GGS21DRAFT_514127 [Xylaria nigripes]|nr:hypothetical protein GGS21DRAFT_514127 [Xylaria nigripes]
MRTSVMAANTCGGPQSIPCHANGDIVKQRQSQRPPPNRRRDKPQLSCKFCRRRKLRCDRQYPCSTCKKRGLDLTCTYVTNKASSVSSGAQDSLEYLEYQLFSHMNHNAGANLSVQASTSSDFQKLNVSPAPSDFGSLNSDDTETKYQDSTHWNSILNAIAKLRKAGLDEPDDPRSASKSVRATPDLLSTTCSDAPMLYGCSHCSKDEILAAVPSRNVTDRLISEFFELLESSSCAVNKCQFLKEYSSFWEDPQAVPVLWLGLLFSIISVTINIRESDVKELWPGSQLDRGSFSAIYREKTVQCLILGQYTRCGPYVIETLFHYFAAEFTTRREANNETWLILSTTVQLAMRMGYHRDPVHFESISPYEGESRRRVWAMLFHLDIAVSGQLGVPRLINDSIVDTAEPRNLLDSDFDSSTVELPTSRPDSEPTPMLAILSKFRTAQMYATVVSVVTNIRPPTYTQILQADRQIEEMFLKIPKHSKFEHQLEMVDITQGLFQRILIQMNYYKALIILHWRYLTPAYKEDEYEYSTRRTVSAALDLLKLYQIVYEGLKIGGHRRSFEWRLTCFFNHGYMLATSILCFYLHKNGDKIKNCELSEIKQTLRQSMIVTVPRIPLSTEIKRVAAAIELAVSNIFEHEPDGSSNDTNRVLTPGQNSEPQPPERTQDPFAGAMLPFFDPMLQGTPMLPSHISNMESFIYSVLTGSVDPWPADNPGSGSYFF